MGIVLPPAPDEEPEFIEVWEENIPAVSLFFELDTAWKILVGFSAARYVGFDWPAVESVMRLKGIRRKKRAVLFSELKVMERAAKEVLNAEA